METKTFIQLSDILSRCFTCRHCGASIQSSLNKLQPGLIKKCPNCHREWAEVAGNGIVMKNYESEFLQFVSAIMEVQKLMGEDSIIGFSFSLEIKHPQAKS